MAAHSVNILLELVEDCCRITPEIAGRYLHALGFAPGMDELELGAWQKLNELLLEVQENDHVMRHHLRKVVVSILGKQIAKWEKLGWPESHEDWVKARYGGV